MPASSPSFIAAPNGVLCEPGQARCGVSARDAASAWLGGSGSRMNFSGHNKLATEMSSSMASQGGDGTRSGEAWRPNLYRLGVPDKTIQAILRHSKLSTTMHSYVKSVPQDAVAAMRLFETACRKYAPRSGRRKPRAPSERTENAPLMHPDAR